MSRAERIEEALAEHLAPVHTRLLDETHKHDVPPDAESHWNLVVVSPRFAGCRLVQRHRAVYDALGPELRAGIHALTMRTLTPEEWAAEGGAVDHASPPCLGGSKADRQA
jgi:BolA protein